MSNLFPSIVYGRGERVLNRSVAQQAFTAATRAQVLGTLVKVPAGGLVAGARYKVKFNVTKTAAGSAASTIDVSIGTAGTVADTARLSFTKPAGTAAADEGVIELLAVFRTIAATGILVGEFTLIHNLAATGHAQVPVVALYATSAAFDNTAEELYIATNLTTGAADVVTVEVAEAELVQAFPSGA